MDTYDTVCNLKYRVVGMYLRLCHSYDGQKYVCKDELMADIRYHECIVYSFGIRDDWTFEDTIADFGCNVSAHDPTINHATVRSENARFEKVCIPAATINEKEYQTL